MGGGEDACLWVCGGVCFGGVLLSLGEPGVELGERRRRVEVGAVEKTFGELGGLAGCFRTCRGDWKGLLLVHRGESRECAV